MDSVCHIGAGSLLRPQASSKIAPHKPIITIDISVCEDGVRSGKFNFALEVAGIPKRQKSN
jgi:hypothetical protein